MAKSNKKESDVFPTFSTQLQLKQKISEITVNGKTLNATYICLNDESKITLLVLAKGEVHIGPKSYLLESTKTDISDTSVAIGSNNGLKGKRIIVRSSVSGEKGTPCTLIIKLKGGFSPPVYNLITKVGEGKIVDFKATFFFR